MNLIIFDIDGTIINSKAADDAIFMQSMREVFNIDLEDSDWSKYQNVTDEGISREAFKKAKGKEMTASEKAAFKDHFLKLTKDKIHQYPEQFKPIYGIKKFMKDLDIQKEISVGIATGGWEETAKLKLQHAGIDYKKYSFAWAGEHVGRKSIILDVIDQAAKREGERGFNRIVSVGDGYWDYKTAKELDISFIGVDVNQEGKFKDLPVDLVVRDFSDNISLLRYVLS